MADVLVEENHPATGACLWMVDTLEDVGVSLDAEQVKAVLPHMQRWVGPQPAPDAGGEWRVGSYDSLMDCRRVYAQDGHVVATASSEYEAIDIVRDHTLAASVPKLAQALKSRVSPTRCYCNVTAGNKCADCEHRELLTSINAALAQLQEKG